MHPISAALFLAVWFFISYSSGDLHAYLDPGTGSIALQLIIGAVVGTLATLRLYWARLRSLVRKERVRDESTIRAEP